MTGVNGGANRASVARPAPGRPRRRLRPAHRLIPKRATEGAAAACGLNRAIVRGVDADGKISSMNYIVGVDIGGTFTDCAVFNPASGSFTTAKAATTPSNPAEG